MSRSTAGQVPRKRSVSPPSPTGKSQVRRGTGRRIRADFYPTSTVALATTGATNGAATS